MDLAGHPAWESGMVGEVPSQPSDFAKYENYLTH